VLGREAVCSTEVAYYTEVISAVNQKAAINCFILTAGHFKKKLPALCFVRPFSDLRMAYQRPL
jgi:hypothetical protein